MRKLFALCFMSMTMLAASAQKTNIMVLANPNVMAPELLVQEGTAFATEDAQTPFLYKESARILETLVDTVRKYRPKVVLIPGDMTKAGEGFSHLTVVKTLQAMQDEGATVLVIPGDQDINNAKAVSYEGNTTKPAQSISVEEFTALYSSFGYGEQSERDANSLSYACEPIEGLVVFGIDLTSSDGWVKTGTLEWLTALADRYTTEGKQMVGMIHYNAIDHFKAQSDLAADCVVKGWQDFAHELTQHGIHLLFTGHQHVQDAAKFYTTEERTDSLMDIATGTLTMYPNAWRLFSINEQLTEWSGQTGYITEVPEVGNVKTISKTKADTNFKAILTELIVQNWEPIAQVLEDNKEDLARIHLENIQTPEQLSDLAIKYLDGTFRKVIYAHLEGNEPQGPVKSKDIQEEIEDAAWDLLGDQLKWYEIAEKPVIFPFIKNVLKNELYPGLNSLLDDINQYDTPQASVTDDLAPFITLPRAEKRDDAVVDVRAAKAGTAPYYTLDGRILLHKPTQKGIYLHQGKKSLQY